jgi:hypothetical protein
MSLSIDYPDRKLNRLTTFFRLLAVIPVIWFSVILVDQIILVLVACVTLAWEAAEWRNEFLLAGFISLPTALMLLFRQKYPRWWFDWNLAMTRLFARVWAYLTLLTDEFPSIDEEQAVHIDIPYPNAKEDLNRWLPLVKWILAIPHWIVLFFLYSGVLVAAIIAWFAILFTGRYPKPLFDFVVGVFRWFLRVGVYAIILTTDRYPPFRLSD